MYGRVVKNSRNYSEPVVPIPYPKGDQIYSLQEDYNASWLNYF